MLFCYIGLGDNTDMLLYLQDKGYDILKYKDDLMFNAKCTKNNTIIDYLNNL